MIYLSKSAKYSLVDIDIKNITLKSNNMFRLLIEIIIVHVLYYIVFV